MHAPLGFDKPLCASLDGFTLHAATRAGALDTVGRETLCKYILRPAVAQERTTRGPDGLVRIALKRPFLDGTVAVDLDPLSRLLLLAHLPAGCLRARAGPGRTGCSDFQASLTSMPKKPKSRKLPTNASRSKRREDGS